MTDGPAQTPGRSLAGWAFLVLFVVWNALMILMVLGALAAGQRVPDEPAMAAAQSFGGSLGLGGTLALWAAGAALLGAAAWLTGRRRRG